MLETKIEELTTSIEKLCKILSLQGVGVNMTPTTVDKQPDPVPAKKEDIANAEPDKTEVTEKDLQDICLAKVRTDKANRIKIKKILEGKLIKDWGEADYFKLKTQLEAL